MQNLSEIKKGKGIDDVVRGISPGRVEDERLVEVVGERRFADLLERFGAYVTSWKLDRLPREEDIVLSPSEINELLQATVQYENSEDYLFLGSVFLNHLIKYSYENGNNGFRLDTTNLLPLTKLGNNLHGERGNRLKLVIDGNVGNYLCEGVSYMVLSVKGDVKYRGCHNMKHSRVTIDGNVGQEFAKEARNSIFMLNGEAGVCCGEGATGCTFYTTNGMTRERLRVFAARRNRVVYIRPDGKKEQVEPDARYY